MGRVLEEGRVIDPAGFVFPVPAAMTPAQNTFVVPVHMTFLVGIIADPGQNGHWYLDVAPPLAAPNQAVAPDAADASWVYRDYLAFRNNQGADATRSVAGQEQMGIGRGLQAFVPAGYWYRLRTLVINGYSSPTFVTDAGRAFCQPLR